MKNPNKPEPNLTDMAAKDKLRDLAIFVVGIKTALRAGGLIRLT